MSEFVLREFSSKRNLVRLLDGAEGLYVEKTFRSADAAENEAAVYRMLSGSGLKTADLLEQSGVCLRLSFLEGEDYLSLLERQERGQFSLVPWASLLDWLYAFHRVTGLVQSDVNLRNFLWLGDAAAGLDFEDSGRGSMTGTFARLAAYVLLYDPPGTNAKKNIVAYIEKRVIEQRLCDRDTFFALVRHEEALLCKRRERRHP